MKKFLFCLKSGLLISSVLFSRANTILFDKQDPADSTFKDWYYTPTGVFGRIPLSKINGVGFVHISRMKDQSVSVHKYNPAGILVNTTDVKFYKGKLSLVTQTNQWGETFDSVRFKPDGPDEFIVTEKLRGQNPYLPCKAVRYVYKNDLLQDMIFLMDSTKPGFNQDGVSHYKFERYRDPQRFGLIKTESYYGDIDNWVISLSLGCHKIVNEYNETGNLILRSTYGLKEEPFADRTGNFKLKIHHDKNDNEIRIDYFDVKGNPINGNWGYSHLERDYRAGFPTRETYSNLDYAVIKFPGKSDSFPIVEHKYNAMGNEIERSNYDEEHHPISNSRGIFKTVFNYNSSGMLTDVYFFDTHSLPAVDETGVHSYHFERNNKGQITNNFFFTRRGMPMKDPFEGGYETKYVYDNWGRIVSTSYWINDSVKMQNRNGFHEVQRGYDENGQPSWMEFQDKNNKVTKGNNKYSKQLFTYNDQGLLDKREFYDGSKPIMIADDNIFTGHYHLIKYNYDINRRVSSIEYFDDGGKPVNANVKLEDNTRINFQRVEFSYNAFQIVSEKLYSENSQTPPVALDCPKGNCINPAGTGIVFRILTKTRNSSVKNRINIVDSLVYGKQMAFLSPDTILIFLNGIASRLSQEPCATLYRIAAINKYYQLNGVVTDYYLENDTIAAILNYKEGNLDGPCIYYYENGNIKEKGEYRKAVRTGVWDYYYEDGPRQKSINFTDNGILLIDCFAANGKQTAQNGNGIFEGYVMSDFINAPLWHSEKGNVKNGLPDGEWEIYSDNKAGIFSTEKFSSGKFIKGTFNSALGQKTSYKGRCLSKFDNIHPEERLDYYGQNDYCNIPGKQVRYFSDGKVPIKSLISQIHDGFNSILQGDKYKDYIGWIFFDVKYDENGRIIKKYVRLYQQNAALEKEIFQMLDNLNDHPSLLINNEKAPFEKFYIVLVESNEIAIPEELLQISRSTNAH